MKPPDNSNRFMVPPPPARGESGRDDGCVVSRSAGPGMRGPKVRALECSSLLPLLCLELARDAAGSELSAKEGGSSAAALQNPPRRAV
jgi:hypothetical protein